MNKILLSLPVDQKVGIAFSGGLDTSAAIAWMRQKGSVPYAYTADLGQPDEDDFEDIASRARAYGAEEARTVDCVDVLVNEGLVAIMCGAFHIESAGKKYFNTTPLGRAVTGTILVRAMQADDVNIWGDGSTYKGNDIERFYRYGLMTNPNLRIYKPWLDRDFVAELGGRAEMSGFDVRPGDPKLKSASFSGGNQQKLILARELEKMPDVLLVGQPTRGVDIGAIELIHEKIVEMRDGGCAVLLVSVELDEIMALADRIVVLYEGQIVAEIKGRDANKTQLGLMMANAHQDDAAGNSPT